MLEKYLSHLANLSKYHEQTYDYLVNLDNDRFSLLSNKETIDKGSIHSLMNTSPILNCDFNLYKIAKQHGLDLDASGDVGHVSIEGLNLEERLQSFGILSNCYSEVCSFGKACPIGILIQLLTDDEDIDNSHNRDTLVNGTFTNVGLSIQKHKTFGSSCVITLVKI